MNWSELVKTRTRRILLMVTGFVVLLVVISLWLPAKWRLQREIVIAAPPAVVFPYLNSLKQWREWTVWYAENPDLPTEYSGPEAGIGATSRWTKGESRGALKIMNSRKNASVEYMLIFDGGDQVMHGILRLVPMQDDRTQVVWRVGGEAGANPLERYMVFAFKYFIGRDFDRSLEKLREVAEAKATETKPAK